MSQTVRLRVSLYGSMLNAARCIVKMKERLKRVDPGNEDAEYDEQADSEIFMLNEIAEHAKETRAGKHSIEAFADFYCLKEHDSTDDGDPRSSEDRRADAEHPKEREERH